MVKSKNNSLKQAKPPAKLGYLTSWKEIAEYMHAGVRTIQRYEREMGLPVRRPTGKSRGAVMATKPELDAWIVAIPLHKTFDLSHGSTEALAPHREDYKIENGSPYCSDPNCKSCNDLRNAQKQISRGTVELSQRLAS